MISGDCTSWIEAMLRLFVSLQHLFIETYYQKTGLRERISPILTYDYKRASLKIWFEHYSIGFFGPVHRNCQL